MRPLAIGEKEKKAIKQLIEYARTHPYSREKLQLIVDGMEQAPGDIKPYSISLPVGFKVVFTIEDQPMGICKHLSVSVDDPKKLPSPEAINMIAEEFGFVGTVENMEYGTVFLEEESNAINIIQKNFITN